MDDFFAIPERRFFLAVVNLDRVGHTNEMEPTAFLTRERAFHHGTASSQRYGEIEIDVPVATFDPAFHKKLLAVLNSETET